MFTLIFTLQKQNACSIMNYDSKTENASNNPLSYLPQKKILKNLIDWAVNKAWKGFINNKKNSTEYMLKMSYRRYFFDFLVLLTTQRAVTRYLSNNISS